MRHNGGLTSGDHGGKQAELLRTAIDALQRLSDAPEQAAKELRPATTQYRALFDATELHPLPVQQNGNIFRVDRAYFVESEEKGTFTLVVHNSSGNWVAVNIDRSQGVADTGHIQNGENGGFTEAIQLYSQRDNKVTRWRPGAFGIPGNGGGEVWFNVPISAGSAYLEITVVG